MSAETDRGFLSRWSQRKQAARQQVGERAEDEQAGLVDEPSSELSHGEPEGEAQHLGSTREEVAEANRAAAEAVDLETLAFDSDFSLFLKEGVSTQLKNAALRKLWRSNPVLACVDGLNDYDEDYRTVETFADGIRSSWQVGKGYSWMSEVEEKLEAVADAVDIQPASDEVLERASGEAMPDTPQGLEIEVSDLSDLESDDPKALAETPEAESEPVQERLSLMAPMTRDDGEVARPRTPAAQEPARPARRRVRFT
ncbi:DUF3306 domain-containing protein [Stappia indica]|uniref:DUF3306 domain-containing protein n=1 Tax=Stappia indica TaxID=538381 RepID=A0A857C295_9HYPH|nr:DUF3306 domain-containing protein [Stappia indica]QGZ33076.1 DUF3306 domain-containing protein [Stappia indica]